jgi:polyhydroxyalkanoate synthesis regulator phasin
MPRKPTPSILNDEPASSPVEEILPPPVEVQPPSEVQPPTEEPPPVAAKPVKAAKKSTAKTAAAVPAAVEAVQEAIPELPAEAAEPPAEPKQKILIAFPRHALRTGLLASLGVASYAVEETKTIIHKLVERGELTEKQGKKLLDELSKRRPVLLRRLRVRRRVTETAPDAEAEAPEKLDSLEELSKVADPAAEVGEEEEEGKPPHHVYTVNLFSPGSNVNIIPPKKAKS